MRVFYKHSKSNNLLLSLILITFSFCYLTAQSNDPDPGKTSISTKPFSDATKHWYNIKEKTNIINPSPNQPQYPETEFKAIADNIIYFQRDNGGWPKNYDIKAILTPEQINAIVNTKSTLNTTFDNGTTYTHIYYLAQAFPLTLDDKYKEACIKGVDYILAAQYPNGGWPQDFPLEEGYSRHITFNDGAYMGIMNLLDRIVKNDPDFFFIDAVTKKKIVIAYEKGIECILKMQITEQGKRTAWCQQHDEITLLPTWARKFEPPSICNAESADIVLFLMRIDKPSKKVIEAVQGAVKWFSDSKILNTKVETFNAPDLETKYTTKAVSTDRRVVTDPKAPPIWTRIYELVTERPLFCDRDSRYLYSLAEVSRERRAGYAWYTYNPEKVLAKYPEWQKKWAPTADVLKP